MKEFFDRNWAKDVMAVILTTLVLVNLYIYYFFPFPQIFKWSFPIVDLILMFFIIKLKMWRVSTVILLMYVVIFGFYVKVPAIHILNETIRNLFFHVPMWLAMTVMLMVSMYNSIIYLYKGKIKYDYRTSQFVNMGIVFGVLGFLTGMVWAKHTWGDYLHGDPKQKAVALAMLVYLVYLVLRSSIKDGLLKARISASYNVLAFPTFVALIYFIPRMSTESMHPGSENSPAFSSYDTSDVLKMVYYPAVFGWLLLGVWLVRLRVKLNRIKEGLCG